jgi:hypothetical protein
MDRLSRALLPGCVAVNSESLVLPFRSAPSNDSVIARPVNRFCPGPTGHTSAVCQLRGAARRSARHGREDPICKDASIQSQQWKVLPYLTRCQPDPVNTQIAFQSLSQISHSCSFDYGRVDLCTLLPWPGTKSNNTAPSVLPRSRVHRDPMAFRQLSNSRQLVGLRVLTDRYTAARVRCVNRSVAWINGLGS